MFYFNRAIPSWRVGLSWCKFYSIICCSVVHESLTFWSNCEDYLTTYSHGIHLKQRIRVIYKILYTWKKTWHSALNQIFYIWILSFETRVNMFKELVHFISEWINGSEKVQVDIYFQRNMDFYLPHCKQKIIFY